MHVCRFLGLLSLEVLMYDVNEHASLYHLEPSGNSECDQPQRNRLTTFKTEI